MINVRRSADRFHAERDWLKSAFTFSFGPFQDPAYNGFRALKVLNEDRVAPGKGFGPHSHRDMEIITYVLEGRLAHRDSMGERHTLGANEIQAMSAGDGIIHSEFNGSDTEPSHSIQIWIEPRGEDLTPTYRQFAFPPAEKRGRLRLLVAPEPAGDTVAVINQDARMYVAELDEGQSLRHQMAPGRHAWAQVVRGSVRLNGMVLEEGDGAAVSDERELAIEGRAGAGEVLLFDLA
jgi:redox-sensitive bicupin YhaK (pirin superfamily)